MKCKNNKNISLLIFMALLTLASFSSCKENKSVSANEGYYTCSMHPQVIEQEPGPCPICGMKMTFIAASKKKKMDHSKMNNEGKSETGDKKITPANFQFSLAENLLANSKLITVPAKKETFSRKSKYSGHVDYNEDPNRLVIINTKYDGWVERLYVSKEGQRISKNKALMGIYSPEILAAKEEYVTTYLTIKGLYQAQNKDIEEVKNDPTVKAARQKLVYLDVSGSQISKLERDGKSGRLSYYHSPISGVIIKKEVLQGQFIKAGQELLRIANMGRLWIFIHIFEKDMPFVKKGQKVNLTTSGYPDKIFHGKIDLIYPFLNPQTKDIKVRIVVNNNRKQILKPGMFTDVEVTSGLPGKQIIIPDSAIIYSGDKTYVFVSLGDGDFEVRPLKVKIASDGRAVISKGLKKDELVVINGQFLLDSEASLKEAMSKGQMTGHNH